ncbi:MAG: GspH/FimT family pseudopilin [Pseudomonas sp.]|uniref:GspH/FimT family pseudopilin n=1 Tax=Pseudomonas sp. TaxID=306 RepID=UPI003392708C
MLRTSHMRGFSLVELTIVVALVAIIGTIAAPSFSDLLRSSQLQTSAEEFSTFLQYARSQAIISRTPYEIEFVAASDRWEAKNLATGTVERGVTLDPTKVSLLAFDSAGASVTKITYSAIGTADRQTFITLCKDNDVKTGHRIILQPSGSTRLSKAGKKDNKLTSPDLVSCTAP